MADRRLNPVVRLGGADQQQMGEREPAEQPVADAGHVQPGPLDRTGQVHRGADWEAERGGGRMSKYYFRAKIYSHN